MILGPEFGYFPNAGKTTVVVKEEFLKQAKVLFDETGIKITTDGHKVLGAACGKRSFVDGYSISISIYYEAHNSKKNTIPTNSKS